MLKRRLTISYADGRPINELVKRVFEERPTLPEEVAKFEVQGGKTALFGAGDGTNLTLVLEFESMTKDQLEIADYITGLANEFGAEVSVVTAPDEDASSHVKSASGEADEQG